MKKESVVAIIVKDNKILLCEKYPFDDTVTGWCLPGGKVEKGEQLVDALKREIKEEVGLIVTNVWFFTLQENKKFYINFFWCKVEGDIKLNTNELKSCKYFSIDELPDTLLPITKKVLLYNSELIFKFKG